MMATMPSSGRLGCQGSDGRVGTFRGVLFVLLLVVPREAHIATIPEGHARGRDGFP